MDRMKTFLLYALCVIGFFIFSNVMMNLAIHGTYKTMHVDLYKYDGIEMQINENKYTSVNGYVGGKIINNTKDIITNKYIKIDIYSKRDVLLGTKYVTVNNFRPNETREFKMGYKLNNSNYCKIHITDTIEADVKEEQFISDELGIAALFAAVILLCYL